MDELIILKNIDPTFKYIARDEDGELFLYDIKPAKSYGQWWVKGCKSCDFRCYNHLFKDISWEDEEPTLIEVQIKWLEK